MKYVNLQFVSTCLMDMITSDEVYIKANSSNMLVTIDDVAILYVEKQSSGELELSNPSDKSKPEQTILTSRIRSSKQIAKLCIDYMQVQPESEKTKI